MSALSILLFLGLAGAFTPGYLPTSVQKSSITMVDLGFGFGRIRPMPTDRESKFDEVLPYVDHEATAASQANKAWRSTVSDDTNTFAWVREEAEMAFRRFDTNGDGYISPAELSILLRDYSRITGNELDLTTEFALADLNDDGRISFSEFVGYWEAVVATVKSDLASESIGQLSRDKRLAENDPARWCLERCLSTGRDWSITVQ